MEYEIEQESTRRTVHFKITGTELLNYRPYGWDEPRERLFQPVRAVVVVLDAERRTITLHGPALLKGGRLSDITNLSAEWRRQEMDSRYTAAPPAWVLKIWGEVDDR